MALVLSILLWVTLPEQGADEVTSMGPFPPWPFGGGVTGRVEAFNEGGNYAMTLEEG